MSTRPGAVTTGGHIGTWIGMAVLLLGAYLAEPAHATEAVSAAAKDPELAVPQAASVILDRVAPRLTLLGNPSVWLEAGAAYSDAGATAADDVDGDLTSRIVAAGDVNAGKAGTYNVTYSVSDTAGNAAEPLTRTVRVTQSYPLTVAAPAYGTLLVNPQPVNGKYAAGTVVTLSYVPNPQAGADVARWTGATADGANPSLARVTMDQARTVSVALTRHTGTVVIQVNPEKAPWTLTDGDGKSRTGTGSATLAGVPAGPVAVVYGPVAGMGAPARREALLAKAGTVTFQGVYTTNNTVQLAAASGLEGVPGATVACPVTVSGGLGLAQYRMTFTYDPAVVEAASVSAGNLVSKWSKPTVQAGTGQVTVSGAGAPTTVSGGTLVTVTLKVKQTVRSGATTVLGLGNVTLNDGAFGVSAQPGDLTVTGNAFLWGDVNRDGKAGDADASLVLQHRVGLVTSLGDGAAAANVSGETPAVIGTVDASLLLTRAAGSTAPFPADANGDGYGPEAAGAAVPAPRIDGTTRVARMASDMELEAGKDVTVPLTVDDGRGAVGYLARVQFDPALVDFLSAGPGGLSQTWTAPVVHVGYGEVTLAAAGAQAATQGGVLAMLTFRARQHVAHAGVLRLASVELNDGFIPCVSQASGGAPVATAIAPARGAESGGTVVTLDGTRLGDVTEVRFGGQPAPWFEVRSNGRSLTAITPAGKGTVDVSLVAPAGTGTLRGAFTYFPPQVYLTIDPPMAVDAGAGVDVPVWLDTAGGTVSSVTFELHYDATLFATRRSGAALVTVGTAANAAKKGVQARLVAPGRIAVTVSGSPATEMKPGLLCTVHLLALGDASDATGLIYVTGISAQSRNAKALEADGGAKRR